MYRNNKIKVSLTQDFQFFKFSLLSLNLISLVSISFHSKDVLNPFLSTTTWIITIELALSKLATEILGEKSVIYEKRDIYLDKDKHAMGRKSEKTNRFLLTQKREISIFNDHQK